MRTNRSHVEKLGPAGRDERQRRRQETFRCHTVRGATWSRFQVIDDILDVTQTSEILGKSAGKDVAAKKATYPAVIGLEKSRAEARRSRARRTMLCLYFAERR